MPITNDTVVSMTYILKNDKGEILDQSGDSPLVYLHGHQNIVPGLERALEGLETGASKAVSVAPVDGYGEYEPKMKLQIPREKMGDDLPPIDTMIRLQDGSGQTVIAKVCAIDDKTVTLDANHPLAGQTLNFEVTITDTRPALPDELAHGHVHSEGCHHH